MAGAVWRKASCSCLKLADKLRRRRISCCMASLQSACKTNLL